MSSRPSSSDSEDAEISDSNPHLVIEGPLTEAMRTSLRYSGDKLDMENRDTTNINTHIKVSFEDVFAEPESFHSIDEVWRTSFSTFMITKDWSYRIISAIFGIPSAILCGIYFACIGCYYVWCITPCLRACMIELQCVGKLFSLCLDTFCNPFFESLGRIFGGIKVEKSNKICL